MLRTAAAGLAFIHEEGNWYYERELQWLYAIETESSGTWYYSPGYGWLWNHVDYGDWIFSWAFGDGAFSLKRELVEGLASEISQWGITWTFDRKYPYGRFANGDYWVQGPLTVTRITPEFTGKHHGWNVNPRVNQNAYDVRLLPYGTFNANLVPALPYRAYPGQSILKSISRGSEPFPDEPCHVQYTCLNTAAVLTVVGEPPPGHGADVFRPPYIGTDKPYYDVADVRTELLASLEPTARAPELATLERWFERVWLHHRSGWMVRTWHPEENLPDYHAGMARRTAKGALALHLDYGDQDKTQAIIKYLQVGIDIFHMFENGRVWNANSGASQGAVTPMVYAAVLLDDERMKQTIANADHEAVFGEGGYIYHSEAAGRALFGVPCNERTYWENQVHRPLPHGRRTCRDPYGYIDGGETPGEVYQNCCFSQPFRGAALAMRFVGGEEVFTYEPFFEYADRWMEHGAWTQPDPCAHAQRGRGVPSMDDYGVTFGPDGAVGCIEDEEGLGRYPDLHGHNRASGGWDHPFLGEMWQAHRASLGGDG